MAITAVQFRLDFPVFADTNIYPDSMINFWLTLGYLLLNQEVWTSLQDTGVELYVAHNCVVEAQNNRAGLNGGIPGTNVGILTSKSVGGAAASYDTASVAFKDWGSFNTTNYGIRFIQLANIAGMSALSQFGSDQPINPVVDFGSIGGNWGGD